MQKTRLDPIRLAGTAPFFFYHEIKAELWEDGSRIHLGTIKISFPVCCFAAEYRNENGRIVAQEQ